MAAQPPRRKPAQKQQAGRHNDLAIIALIGAVAIVLAFVYQSFHTDGFSLSTKKNKDGETAAVTEIYGADAIRINEVMSANDSAYYTQTGKAVDWVEVTNTSASSVNLAGYTLAKSAADAKRFTFPEMTLSPGECCVVFCDKKNAAAAGYEFHAPFSLSRAGDTLMLFNPAGTAVDSVNLPEMENNASYIRVDANSWEVTSDYTPGLANTRENHASFRDVLLESPVEISEIMAKNTSYAPDAEGQYHDYIELHNTSSQEVDISGWHLSDNRNEVMKWAFPEGTVIPAGGYLLIYASGLTRTGEMHASFKLSTEGEQVVLSNENGQLLDLVEYPLLTADQAYSKDADGQFKTTLAPTPGMANTTESAALISDQFAAQNGMGVYIMEVAASTNQQKYDWVELYNASSQEVDLSGCGISDNTGKPRKYRFPQGTVIPAGGYLGIFFSGLDQIEGSVLNVPFRLSADGGYTLCLSTPEGALFDRMFVPQQYSNVSYGRLPGRYGRCYYFTTSTPLAENVGPYYDRKAAPAVCSVPGGVYENGQVLTVTLSAQAGDRIYYTTDCTVPTENSTLYTGPITISSTTILRTRVYSDSALESYVAGESFLFGISHTVRVVSLVSDPDGLFSDENGIMVKGPNAYAEYPYGAMGRGANFWMDWEREAHVEMFDTDGSTMFSQECGVKLQGQYSRAENQKAFKIYARNQYSGDNRFHASIFSKRDYTDYKSFILRASSQDSQKTRMRDSILTSLAEGTSVFYQETELCVVYLNGEYWGQYNIREHINAVSICKFEGWEGQEDDIDLVKANTNVFRGSNESFEELLTWIKNNDTSTDAAYDYIDQRIDIRNYIEYMAIEIFTGNTDTLNVKRYRNANADGKWRWVLYDLDWAFETDTDSIRRWITPGGMGNMKRTDNTLFIGCMKNPRFRDEFLTYFGEQMATTFSTQNIYDKVMARHALLEPELEKNAERWDIPVSKYTSAVKYFLKYALERPTKLLGYFQGALNLSEADMQKYFGAAYEEIQRFNNSDVMKGAGA